MSASTRAPAALDTGDPHHVVGADLQATERVLDCGPGRDQVPAAAEQLRVQRSEPADPLWLGGDRDQRLDVGEPAFGNLIGPFA